jgi:hypothetical protein
LNLISGLSYLGYNEGVWLVHQLAGRISLIPVNKREYSIHQVRYTNVTERGANKESAVKCSFQCRTLTRLLTQIAWGGRTFPMEIPPLDYCPTCRYFMVVTVVNTGP